MIKISVRSELAGLRRMASGTAILRCHAEKRASDHRNLIFDNPLRERWRMVERRDAFGVAFGSASFLSTRRPALPR